MEPTSIASPRQESRRRALLEAAARRFLEQGYAAASMRDIAADVGMQVGSIYYHFPSKAELRAAVHEEGLRRIHAAVTEATAEATEPWERLEAACTAHLSVLLDGGDFFQVVMRELPRAHEPGWGQLVALRDGYEALFAGLLADLPLPADTDRQQLRLMLLGALNWSHTWYRAGTASPRSIARHFVGFLRRGLDVTLVPGTTPAAGPARGSKRASRSGSPR